MLAQLYTSQSFARLMLTIAFRQELKQLCTFWEKLDAQWHGLITRSSVQYVHWPKLHVPFLGKENQDSLLPSLSLERSTCWDSMPQLQTYKPCLLFQDTGNLKVIREHQCLLNKRHLGIMFMQDQKC